MPNLIIHKAKSLVVFFLLFSLFVFSAPLSVYASTGSGDNNFLASIFDTLFHGKTPSEKQSNYQDIQQAHAASHSPIKEVAGISIDSDTVNNLLKRVGTLEFQLGSFSPQNSNALVIDTTGVNLLKNSSFEAGVGGIPTQWSATLDSNTGNTFSNGEGVHSGSYGLKFVGGGTGNFGIYQSSTKTVPGRTYTYSAWVKETNASNATFRLGFWDEQNNKEGTFKNISLSGTRDWFRVSMTIATPGLITDAKNYYPMLQVQGLTKGNVYVDDIQLIEGSVLTPYNSAQASIGTGGLSLSDLGGGILHSNGSGNITSSSVNLASGDVSGTLTVGNGGTGQTSFTANGVLYGNGTSGLSILAPGTSGYVLQTNAASSAPSWVAASGLTAGSIPFSGITTATNTTAAMTIGTGASLTFSGTGTINANQLNGQTTSVAGALTTAAAFTTSGANALTLTTTAATNVTLPTTGTLSTLAGTETLTNKTLTAPTINGTVATTGLTLPAFTASGNITGSGSPTISSFGAINGLTLTANATGFSVAGGTTSKTLTVNNTLTFAGTDATTITFQGTDTYVGRATTDTLTNKTLTSPVISTIVNTGTLTLPTSTDTLVGRATTDTLTNKTLTSPTIQGTVGAGTGLTMPGLTAAGNLTGSGSPTISSFGSINGLTLTANATGFSVAGGTTSKTLTMNNTLTFAGTDSTTITFQGTDTYVGRTTTDTLTNKTLTAPAINGTVTTTGLTLPAFTSGNITGSTSLTLTTTGSANALTLNTANATSANSGAITIQSGTTTTSGTTGSISIDVGSGVANGTVTIGTTNASGLTIGRSGVTTTLNGTQNVSGQLTLGPATTHFKSSQTTAPTIGTPSACGTTPTSAVVAGSTDSAGSFTITAGTGAPGNCAAVVTFQTAYGGAPKAIVLTPSTSTGGAKNAYVSAIATTTFTVTLATAPAASEANTWYYWGIE